MRFYYCNDGLVAIDGNSATHIFEQCKDWYYWTFYINDEDITEEFLSNADNFEKYDTSGFSDGPFDTIEECIRAAFGDDRTMQ